MNDSHTLQTPSKPSTKRTIFRIVSAALGVGGAWWYLSLLVCYLMSKSDGQIAAGSTVIDMDANSPSCLALLWEDFKPMLVYLLMMLVVTVISVVVMVQAAIGRKSGKLLAALGIAFALQNVCGSLAVNYFDARSVRPGFLSTFCESNTYIYLHATMAVSSLSLLLIGMYLLQKHHAVPRTARRLRIGMLAQLPIVGILAVLIFYGLNPFEGDRWTLDGITEMGMLLPEMAGTSILPYFIGTVLYVTMFWVAMVLSEPVLPSAASEQTK